MTRLACLLFVCLLVRLIALDADPPVLLPGRPEPIPSPNLWHWPEIYELENHAQDADCAIWAALRDAGRPEDIAVERSILAGLGQRRHHIGQWPKRAALDIRISIDLQFRG